MYPCDKDSFLATLINEDKLVHGMQWLENGHKCNLRLSCKTHFDYQLYLHLYCFDLLKVYDKILLKLGTADRQREQWSLKGQYQFHVRNTVLHSVILIFSP